MAFWQYDNMLAVPSNHPHVAPGLQCATFVGNSYQTFGLATVKTYQTESNLTGPNKIMIFYIINAKIHIQTFDYLLLLLHNTRFHALNCVASSQVLQNN